MLIALYSNAPQSGKSVFARIASEEFGFKVVKFADALKDMVRVLLSRCCPPDIVERCVEGDLKEQPLMGCAFGGKTTRQLLQTLGTEWGREMISPSLWTELWLAAVCKHPKVICDDMRFTNEWDVATEAGALTVCIRRPGMVSNGHKSEGALDSRIFDITLTNAGTLEEFQAVIREVLTIHTTI